MNFPRRIARLEEKVGGLEPVESRVAVICALSEAEFESKMEQHEQEHPLESSGRPEPDRIYIWFRRAQAKGPD